MRVGVVLGVVGLAALVISGCGSGGLESASEGTTTTVETTTSVVVPTTATQTFRVRCSDGTLLDVSEAEYPTAVAAEAALCSEPPPSTAPPPEPGTIDNPIVPGTGTSVTMTSDDQGIEIAIIGSAVLPDAAVASWSRDNQQADTVAVGIHFEMIGRGSNLSSPYILQVDLIDPIGRNTVPLIAGDCYMETNTDHPPFDLNSDLLTGGRADGWLCGFINSPAETDETVMVVTRNNCVGNCPDPTFWSAQLIP